MTTLNSDRTATGRSSDMVREHYRDLLAQRLPPGSGTDMPGTPEWARLPENLKAAAVIRLACLWLDEQAARVDINAQLGDLADELAETDASLERLLRKRTAIAVSLAQDYHRPSLDDLKRIRSTVPDARPVDPEAMRRWVATGSSTIHQASTPTSGPTSAERGNAA